MEKLPIIKIGKFMDRGILFKIAYVKYPKPADDEPPKPIASEVKK